MKTRLRRATCAGAFVLGAAAMAPAADTLIDNFDDNNLTNVAPWGNSAEWRPAPTSFFVATFYDPTPIGNGFSLRSISDTTVGTNNNFTQTLVASNGGFALRFTNSNGGIWGSTAPTVANRLQSLTTNILRNANFNATANQYLRFTASYDSTQNPPANARFAAAIMGEVPNNGTTITGLPPVSYGPWSADGSNLDGLILTNTPTVYLLNIKNATTFKGLPGLGGSVTDWTRVRGIQFSIFRYGATAGPGNTSDVSPANGTPDYQEAPWVLAGRFFVDDVMLLDDLPGYTVTGANPTVAEATPATGADISINLSAMPSHSVTVTPVLTTGSGHYTVTPASRIFTTANYATPQTFTVNAVDDATIEGNLGYTLSFSTTTSDLWYAANVPAAQTVTVQDNDLPSASIQALNFTSENETSGTLTVTLSAVSPLASTINYAVNTGASTAKTPEDYNAPFPNPLVIPAGELSADIFVPVVDDNIYESTDDAVQIDLTGGTNVTASYSGTLYIGNNDAFPDVTFAQVSPTILESDITTTVTVTLSRPSEYGAGLMIDVVPGTATEGDDYTNANPPFFNIPPYETVGEYVLGIVNDTLDESDETLSVEYTAPVFRGGPAEAITLTIEDDDPIPAANIPGTINVALAGSQATVTITLGAPSGRLVSIDYTTADGTGPNGAIAGVDYTATGGSLSFIPGDTEESFTVDVAHVGTVSPKTFSILYPTVTNASPTATETTINIENAASRVVDWTISR